jgi:DNA-binding transcriptional ArsR family regulator
MKGYEQNFDLPLFLSRTQDADQALTRFLWMVSSLTRRQILELLAHERAAFSSTSEGLSTNEIVHRLHVASPTVAEHLRLLMKEGLVYTYRKGPQVLYRVSDDPRIDMFLYFIQQIEVHYYASQAEQMGS